MAKWNIFGWRGRTGDKTDQMIAQAAGVPGLADLEKEAKARGVDYVWDRFPGWMKDGIRVIVREEDRGNR